MAFGHALKVTSLWDLVEWCAWQEDLPALYRGHDVFLFTSRYEAWGMPVLEAMASGLAVVATRCLGVDSFSHHLVNCLLADSLVRITAPIPPPQQPLFLDACSLSSKFSLPSEIRC